MSRRCVIIHADGAPLSLFEERLAAGRLPAIAEHVVARGGLRAATSVAPSTTGPAHVPLLCGTYPGPADVPGYRWFDRRTHRPGLPLGPWCLRSYSTEGLRFTGDLAPGVRTIFERARKPVSVFGVLERGAQPLLAGRRKAVWLESHYGRQYDRADTWARRGLLAAVQAGADLAFVNFPGIDWNAHYHGFGSPEMARGFDRVDLAVDGLAAALKRAGAYEDTLIVVCADHGHAPVDTHRDLPVFLDRELGVRTASAGPMAFRPRPQVIACVSGNSMCQLHVRTGRDWSRRPGADACADLRAALLAQDAVDLVITRDGDGALVESRRGTARLSEQPEGVAYRPLGLDPFGFGPLPHVLGSQAALAATFATQYPDALVQVAQLLRSPRTGDVMVTARPGFDLRERFEWPEHRSSHGGLLREHMLTPFAASTALTEGPMRTADVAATVLDWLGAEPLPGVEGVSRLAS